MELRTARELKEWLDTHDHIEGCRCRANKKLLELYKKDLLYFMKGCVGNRDLDRLIRQFEIGWFKEKTF